MKTMRNLNLLATALFAAVAFITTFILASVAALSYEAVAPDRTIIPLPEPAF